MKNSKELSTKNNLSVKAKASTAGITLVSLVVTIIVLIILAGVSINLTLGENGIITKAKQAKENTELAQVEEQTALNELYMQMETEGATPGTSSYDAIAKLTQFKTAIASAITDMGVKTASTDSAETMASNIRNIQTNTGHSKVMYVNNSLKSGPATASLTVPEDVKEGIIFFTDHFYTGSGGNPTYTIPEGVTYDTIMETGIIEASGDTGTNTSFVKIIKAYNIAGKTFTSKTSVGYNRTYIWLFY